MKEAAALVPKVIKTLMKYAPERKVNMQKIKVSDEKQILLNAVNFFKDRFNAEVNVFSENDNDRYDPKNRAVMAMPYQPAIYIE
jgi:leucyl-tRNA synthetase